MKSPYVRDLQPNQIISGTFLVAHKDVRQKKTGEPYLSLVLSDKTGDLEAKMWDNAAEAMGTFERDDFVRVKGMLQVFQNRPQLTVHKLQPVAETEVDGADYFPASTRDRDEMFAELQGWITGIGNPHLKALLEAIFADPGVALAFRTAPAAKTVHHGWIGGLIEHVLSLCTLAKFTASHYANIDFDLLLSGVILHDLGKIHELSYARGFGYTTEGQLIGHIMIGMRMVDEKIREVPGFPPQLRDLLQHLILSHHGQMDFGSPKVPMFPEAMLLHLLDNMDSKMECMRGLIEKDRQVEGVWTGYNSALERSVLKKGKFLGTDVKVEAPPPAPVPAKPAAPKAEPAGAFADKLRGALGRDS
ncbi:MAG TPA: OB-fold nucleic acid binding domain-containing protein [Bryobacteraceae bacterium]